VGGGFFQRLNKAFSGSVLFCGMSKCAILRGLWSFVENNISRFCMRFVLEGCVFREKMNFSIISRAVFFEKFGGVFFLRVGGGRFLESYAIFWGNFSRSGLETGLKSGVGC
jgi:hypothetical protein